MPKYRPLFMGVGEPHRSEVDALFREIEAIGAAIVAAPRCSMSSRRREFPCGERRQDLLRRHAGR